MKTITLIFLLVLYGHPAIAGEVTLKWDPNPEPELAGYYLYQADCLAGKTGPWTQVETIPAPGTTITITVPDGKNFAWYVSAYGLDLDESRPSNMVELYERTACAAPTGLTKQGN